MWLRSRLPHGATFYLKRVRFCAGGGVRGYIEDTVLNAGLDEAQEAALSKEGPRLQRRLNMAIGATEAVPPPAEDIADVKEFILAAAQPALRKFYGAALDDCKPVFRYTKSGEKGVDVHLSFLLPFLGGLRGNARQMLARIFLGLYLHQIWVT